MLARVTAAGALVALAAALPTSSSPTFSLRSTGAVSLHAAGSDARFGIVPNAVRGRAILMVSLGATGAAGALQLTALGDRLPPPGRYPVRSSWDELPGDSTAFHASFMPGTVERPLGWYHGEAGWVTITEADPGRIAGTFEVVAQGFSAADPLDEERTVTVRGSFAAAADSTVTGITALR
jgi:hypothetical protein